MGCVIIQIVLVSPLVSFMLLLNCNLKHISQKVVHMHKGPRCYSSHWDMQRNVQAFNNRELIKEVLTCHNLRCRQCGNSGVFLFTLTLDYSDYKTKTNECYITLFVVGIYGAQGRMQSGSMCVRLQSLSCAVCEASLIRQKASFELFKAWSNKAQIVIRFHYFIYRHQSLCLLLSVLTFFRLLLLNRLLCLLVLVLRCVISLYVLFVELTVQHFAFEVFKCIKLYCIVL